MKKEKKLWKYFDFYYTELPAVAEYLEKQEAEGYRFKGLENGYKMIFEKSESRKVRYCAEIFKGDTPEEFIQSCENEDWEHIATYNKEIYIFRTENPDAVDIMTDENEKRKVIAKRLFCQPGVWAFLGFAFAGLLRLFSDYKYDILLTPFWVDISSINKLIWVMIYLLNPAIRLFDCLLWRVTGYKNNGKSALTNLKNTIRKRRIYSFFACVALTVGNMFLLWIDPEYFNSPVYVVFLLLWICGSFLYFSLSKVSFDKKVKFKNLIVGFIAVLVCVSGLLGMGVYNGNNPIEKSKSVWSSEDIPVTVSDLNDEVKVTENRERVKGTRFGSIHTFQSSGEIPENKKNAADYLFYNILISDYPSVQQNYIDRILKSYEEYEVELIKIQGEKTQWDYYYRVETDNPDEYGGFAVKGNLIIHIETPVLCEKDLFDVVFEKIYN